MLSIFPMAPAQPKPIALSDLTGQAPARSVERLKVVEQASNVKQLRLNLRIAHIHRKAKPLAMSEKPLATVYLKSGMSRK